MRTISLLRTSLMFVILLTSIPESRADSPLSAPYPHDRRKNRYISFDPNKSANDGTDVAFKVEIKDIVLGSCNGASGGAVDFCRQDRNACSSSGNPCFIDDAGECPANERCIDHVCVGAPCKTDDDCPVGATCFWGLDCRSCEGGSGNACITTPIHCATGGGDCTQTGELCANDAPNVGGSNVGLTLWVGPEHPSGNGIHLLVSEPFRKISDNWPSPTHVGDCEIVPQTTYGVRAVDVGTGDESDELIVETTKDLLSGHVPLPFWWGDVVGALDYFCNGNGSQPECDPWDPTESCGGGAPCLRAWGVPNGVVNFDDVNALIFAISPPPWGVPALELTWVDLHGNDSGLPGSQAYDPPNVVVNASDLQQVAFAFNGFPYQGYDPADCPDVADWP